MNTSKITHYPTSMLALHWLVALLVITAYATGGHPTREGIIGEIHVACGVITALLLLLRLPLRLIYHRRLPVHTAPAWQQTAATAVQYALYAAMLLIPLTGWLALSDETASFRSFGLSIPLIGLPANEFWEEIGDVHEFLGNAFITLAGLHAAAALLHHFWHKDTVLHSMLPWKKSS